MNAKKDENALNLADREGLKAYIGAADAVAEAAAAHIEAIRADAARAMDAKNAAHDGQTAKTNIWQETLAIVGIIADTATGNATKYRDQIYADVMGEFMAKDETGKATSTAAAYASTGRGVLVKLVTQQGRKVSDIAGLKYSEVRKLLKPANNPEAEAMRDEAVKRIKFVAKFADKHGGDEKAIVRLTAILDAIEPHYNAVKAAKDASSSAAKAAKELEANRQQRPEAPMTTETVKVVQPSDVVKQEAKVA